MNGLNKNNENLPVYGKCFFCGCTELDCSNCIEESGKACHWIDGSKTICSVCYEKIRSAFVVQKNEIGFELINYTDHPLTGRVGLMADSLAGNILMIDETNFPEDFDLKEHILVWSRGGKTAALIHALNNLQFTATEARNSIEKTIDLLSEIKNPKALIADLFLNQKTKRNFNEKPKRFSNYKRKNKKK